MSRYAGGGVKLPRHLFLKLQYLGNNIIRYPIANQGFSHYLVFSECTVIESNRNDVIPLCSTRHLHTLPEYGNLHDITHNKSVETIIIVCACLISITST